MIDEIMQQLLYLYDFSTRHANDKYSCGYADGIGQTVLDISKVIGEDTKPYKYEVTKRIMNFTTVEKYIKDYPTPIEG